MLLTASGQNIYPEEIEARLNNMPFINESLIILKDSKLVALVYPDNDEAFAQNMNKAQLEAAIEANRIELNKLLPAYSQITRVKLYPEEFEKPPKKHQAIYVSRHQGITFLHKSSRKNPTFSPATFFKSLF